MNQSRHYLSTLERALSLFTKMGPGEGLAVVLFALNAFLLLVCYYVLKTTREVFILTEQGAEAASYAIGAQALVLLFVVPLVDVEARSGLRFFPELGEERHALPPLCAGGEAGGPSCGVGAMDGRIAGWKLFGQLKLASDCKQLSSAWADVQKAGKLDNMGLMKAEHNEKAGKMACPLTPTVKSV